MSVIWKILGIFMFFWFIWYLTGGPERTTNIKPYLEYNYDNGYIYKSDLDLQTGGKEMINLQYEDGVGEKVRQKVEDNLNNSQFIKE